MHLELNNRLVNTVTLDNHFFIAYLKSSSDSGSKTFKCGRTGGIFTRLVDYAYQILRKMATRWLKLKYIEKNINYKL